MKYEIYKKDIHDIPIKTHVVVYVIVFDDITQQALNELLDNLYATESQKSGFRYRASLSHISIYLYTSTEHADSSSHWIAMLSKNGVDGEIRKTFKEEQIENLNMPHEVKFDLTETERKDIWKKMVLAERQTAREADEYYPIDPSRSEQFGQTFTIERRIPLMPSLGTPSSLEDFSSSVNEVIQLQPGTSLLVTQTQNVRDTTWYLVEARMPKGDFLGKGWVNGIALIGQTYMSTLGQIRSNQEIKNSLQATAFRQISREHNLTLEQLHGISIEGLNKNWPFPKIQGLGSN